MQDALVAPTMPDAASLAAARAWYAGAASREAVARYCPDALGAGRSARGVLGKIRRSLAELARQRHREDLAALFLCDAAQRTRHAKSVARALETLRSLPIPEPQVSDAIDLWLPARAVTALRAHGIATLADLTVRIPRRRRWWTVVIESASMFLKLSLRIAVSFVVMDYGNRPRGSVESSVKPC